MTATQTTAPAYMNGDRPLPLLAQLAAEMLFQADDHGDLPMPHSVRISQTAQQVSLSFPDNGDTLTTLTRWAKYFGGAVTGRPHACDDGQTKTYCQVRFTTPDALNVEAYAFITPEHTTPAS